MSSECNFFTLFISLLDSIGKFRKREIPFLLEKGESPRLVRAFFVGIQKVAVAPASYT